MTACGSTARQAFTTVLTHDGSVGPSEVDSPLSARRFSRALGRPAGAGVERRRLVQSQSRLGLAPPVRSLSGEPAREFVEFSRSSRSWASSRTASCGQCGGRLREIPLLRRSNCGMGGTPWFRLSHPGLSYPAAFPSHRGRRARRSRIPEGAARTLSRHE